MEQWIFTTHEAWLNGEKLSLVSHWRRKLARSLSLYHWAVRLSTHRTRLIPYNKKSKGIVSTPMSDTPSAVGACGTAALERCGGSGLRFLQNLRAEWNQIICIYRLNRLGLSYENMLANLPNLLSFCPLGLSFPSVNKWH